MEFYIRTRGDALDQGYRWVKLYPDGTQELLDPPRVEHPAAKDLIYGEDFSVLLVRTGEQLTLQITGLGVGEQSKRTRRNVQNILLCIGTLDNERTLRGIAVSALQEGTPLACLVDEHVIADPSAPTGFRIDTTLPRHLLSLQAHNDIAGIPGEERISTDLATYRKQLSEELDQYALPTRRAGTLVVVTRHRSHDVLQRAQVWRGLSDAPAQSVPLSTPRATPAQRSQPSWLIPGIVIAVLVVIIGLMMVIF